MYHKCSACTPSRTEMHSYGQAGPLTADRKCKSTLFHIFHYLIIVTTRNRNIGGTATDNIVNIIVAKFVRQQTSPSTIVDTTISINVICTKPVPASCTINGLDCRRIAETGIAIFVKNNTPMFYRHGLSSCLIVCSRVARIHTKAKVTSRVCQSA